MPEPDRIGVFGGTFDPVHLGHIVAARAARDALELDTVLFVVANDPWKKWGRDVASAEDRLTMVTEALSGEEGMEASSIEIDRGVTSYTVDTLDTVHGTHPESDLFLLIGGDIVEELVTWERSDRLPALASIVVIARPGAAPPADAVNRWQARVLPVETPPISSTSVRERLASGGSLEGLVPLPVSAYIVRKGLYGPRP